MDGQTLTADSLIAPHFSEVATANRVDNAQSYPKSQDSVALRIVTQYEYTAGCKLVKTLLD